MQLLDTHERARCAGFGRPDDVARYVTARVLARVVLGRYLDVDPKTLGLTTRCTRCGSTSHGKPQLSEPKTDLELSVSHSGDVVAVGVARSVAVGVDVQAVTLQALSSAVARRLLSDVELDMLDHLPEPARTRQILQRFAQKEAVIKASGLAVPLTRIDVSGLNGVVPAMHLADLQLADGYVASAALVTDEPYVVMERNGESLLAGH